MNNIQILDCTLRDGGYCNAWRFGHDNTVRIINGLLKANVEIIECGFLTNKVQYDPDVTKFSKVSEIARLLPENRERKLFVVMINYGEYDIDSLPPYDGTSIDGIRVAFHKKNRENALAFCEKIKAKGYLVFIQPMVSLSYTDEEFLSIIRCVNKFEPYAFYIVDSFGMMKGKDLTRLFYMIEHNLKETIWIGFHSHNNMQLAYSNSQILTSMQTNRNLIIDSSIFGMGRGAGNLNTELFVAYLNENAGKNYYLQPLLAIIDQILNEFYLRNYWGYSLSNYISAVHNAHPNYASFLDDKKTLTIEGMNEIFSMMDDDKKITYDKAYIEKLYLKYMSGGKVQEEHGVELKKNLNKKKVLLIAPGKSSLKEKDKIISFTHEENPVVISINYRYEYVNPDFIFVSNIRRFRNLNNYQKSKCIVTSNISTDGMFYRANYHELLNEDEMVSDNAGLMAIKFLSMNSVEEIFLAGFDGYSHDVQENYSDSKLELITKNDVLDALNIGMCKVLKEYSTKVKISFLTLPRFVNLI